MENRNVLHSLPSDLVEDGPAIIFASVSSEPTFHSKFAQILLHALKLILNLKYAPLKVKVKHSLWRHFFCGALFSAAVFGADFFGAKSVIFGP